MYICIYLIIGNVVVYTKDAIISFIELSVESAYIAFEDKVYKPNVGIPTGGSLSRQIADIFLHWLLFIKIFPKISDVQAIKLWERFIDDCIGIWRGSRRPFHMLLNSMNRETMKYGIKFPINEVQFGKEVNFLDLTLYLENDNTIQYHGYTKPTDSKRYLNPKSFHPVLFLILFHFSSYSGLLGTTRKKIHAIAS